MNVDFKLPSDAKSGPNCGVTAVAVAAGVTFAEAWSTIKKIGRYGARWRGVTYPAEQTRALDQLGVKYERVWLKDLGVGRRRVTLKKLADKYLARQTLYLVTTTGHIQSVFIDCAGLAWVLDQGGRKPVSEHWGKRKMVTRIIRVDVKVNEDPEDVAFYSNGGAEGRPMTADAENERPLTIGLPLFDFFGAAD